MKNFTRRVLLLNIQLFTALLSFAQIGYSPQIENILQEVTESSISVSTQELSGYIPTSINGNPYTIQSRYWLSEGNEMAAEWIYERFEDYGYSPEYQLFDNTGINVIATKTGTNFPGQYFIICGHYDDMPSGGTAPGADDNASGTVATLEAARILASYDFPYTIKFIAWDEEEIGLVGSYYYANQAATNGDTILGVINLDMIAWDSDGDNKVSIATNNNSAELTSDMVDVMQMYVPELDPNFISTTASDHSPFWQNGYPAVLLIEDWNDFNAYYHTPGDHFDILDIPYFLKNTRASLATLLSLAWDYKMNMQHEQLVSGNFTSEREAVLIIESFHEIAAGDNEPRLYYQVDGGPFDFLAPFEINQDTFRFLIPGQPMESVVNYYFAAQNEASGFVSTLPAGGRGIDPPGTQAPEGFFTYSILDIVNNSLCSQNTPLPIEDLSSTIDTIRLEEHGELLDLNVEVSIEHTYISDLDIYLIAPGGALIRLSSGNGGSAGQYAGTIFDDEAEMSITQASPPFTGHFKPEIPLSLLDGMDVYGDWILKVQDGEENDTGELTDYCLHFQYTNETTTIAENKKQRVVMHQNYPNPVKYSTRIVLELEQAIAIELDVFDLLGRKVKNIYAGDLQKGKHYFDLNVSGLENGQYLYKLQGEQIKIVKPFIITK